MTEPTPVRRKRIVLCRGQYCNLDRRADQYPKSIKLEIATCLSMCGAGPNLVIYPEAFVCNGVSESMLDRIINEHVRENLFSDP
jgi:(2Fe-2S) ferredoxin